MNLKECQNIVDQFVKLIEHDRKICFNIFHSLKNSIENEMLKQELKTTIADADFLIYFCYYTLEGILDDEEPVGGKEWISNINEAICGYVKDRNDVLSDIKYVYKNYSFLLERFTPEKQICKFIEQITSIKKAEPPVFDPTKSIWREPFDSSTSVSTALLSKR